MENASKALLIAAEILIGVLIISIAVQLITKTRSLPKSYESQMTVQEIQKFNVEFTKHIRNDEINGDYFTPQDVVSIFKLKDEWEKKGVTITITGLTASDSGYDSTKKTISNEGEFLNSLLPTYSAGAYTEYIFKISIISYDSQGRINDIKLEKTTKS